MNIQGWFPLVLTGLILQSKVAMLKDKLTQQNRAVDQYSRALDAANKKLSDSYTRQGKLEEKQWQN